MARTRKTVAVGVQVLDAPDPIGYCNRRHCNSYANAADAGFAGAVELRGLSSGQAVRLIPCVGHWHYRHAIKVTRKVT